MVVARVWDGPFAIDKFAAHQVERCADMLEELDIPYFLVRARKPYSWSIGVELKYRDKVVEGIAKNFSESALYVGDAVKGGTAIASERKISELRNSMAIRVGEYVAGTEGRVIAGPDHGCVIEFWEDGADVAKSPDKGVGRLESLKVVVSDEHLQESLVAPRANPVAGVLPTAARKSAEIELGERTYPTFSAFAWDLVTDISFPIDAVYTWVDGSDSEWAQKRDSYLSGAGKLNPLAASKSRYESRDELLYSLRSLEMFAPFIRNVYIVTDGQTPSWLNLNHSRVRVVDHKDIFSDPSDLPVFNSHAIESQLHHIDGLAEHYLYLNDDVMFGRPVTPHLFFHPNGVAKVNPSTYRFGLGEASVDDQPVDAAGKQNSELLFSDFNKVAITKFKHTPHPQQRSILYELEERYAERFKETARSRFRNPRDHSIPSSLQLYYAVLTGRAVFGSVRYSYLNLADPEAFRRRTQALLRKRNFDAFCVNDTVSVEDDGESTQLLDRFLREYFPFKSSFEK
ncbi:stealth family protein [Nocardiopsis rhodophaea]|uniref:Stealth family protein n=2 Tax=Nocardiopsis rhodophaea TaxID=280238 RepID=A0ABP5DRH3_9ACTN